MCTDASRDDEGRHRAARPAAERRGVSGRPSGLTLVELLAVIAIIGLLVGMLLPAVQGARESARRMACGNNIKQVALAIEGHHAANGAYPPGARVSDGSCMPATAIPGAPWTVFILPYLDQRALFDRLQPNASASQFAALQGDSPPEPSIDAAAQNTPLSVFKCPSDSAHRPSDPSSNYMGVQGGGAEADAECRTGSALNHRLRFSTGILFTNSRITAGSIRDGLGNTFLVGESRWWSYRHTNAGFPSWFAWSSANRTAVSWSYPIVLAAATDPINNPLVDYDASQPWIDASGGFTNSLYLGTHTRAFGSRHPGGCHMAMADGSVQFVSETIAIDVYRQLASRRDGRPVGGFAQ
jgi:prepilin-type N-terminal cleavage/methylation domain-containing protein/prepilin-type processing-associated H-X9-DG protein